MIVIYFVCFSVDLQLVLLLLLLLLLLLVLLLKVLFLVMTYMGKGDIFAVGIRVIASSSASCECYGEVTRASCSNN